MKKTTTALRTVIIVFCAGLFLHQPSAQAADFALGFDGFNDYVVIPDAPALNVSAVTMEMWFQWGRSGTAVDFLTSKGIEQLEIHLGGSRPNAVRFIPTTGVYIDTPNNAFTPGQWVHLACVYDPANTLGKIYLNGVDQSVTVTGSLTNAISTFSSALRLGLRADGSLPFSGQMDELRLWNRARSGAEILADMNVALLGNEPGLVACYHFHEGTGTTITSATTNLLTGTFVNEVAWVPSTIGLTPRPSQVQTLPVISYVPQGAALRAAAFLQPGAATGWFEWGTTRKYGTVTPAQNLGPNPGAASFGQLLTNLAANRIYYGRAVITNAAGTNYGSDQVIRLINFSFNGGNPFTNDCSQTFQDPGAIARSLPLAMAAGQRFALAVKADGRVAAWGENSGGQINVPAGLSNVIAVAGGEDHSLALKSDGRVVAWGLNSRGQINVPAGLSNVQALAAGKDYSLALKKDGTVVAWGSALGTVPVGLSNVTAIAANFEHSLALKSDGTVVGWGTNTYGQISIPSGLSNVVAMAAGRGHSLALKSDGTVVGWGDNSSGQSTSPAGLNNVTDISAGGSFSVALRADGTVTGWGNNTYFPPPGLNNVIALAGGINFGLALRGDGTVSGWGFNTSGQLNIPPGLNVLDGVIGVSGTVNTNVLGTNVLTYSITNYLGAVGSATRTVVVADITPPLITLNGANPLTNFVQTAYVEPGATATDACAGDVSGSVTIQGTVNTNVSGSYTLTYRATDSMGNAATTQRTVVVIGGTTLSAPTASGLNLTSGSLNVFVHPANRPTAVYFEYGTTTNYGSFSSTNLLTSNLNTTQAVAQAISGLVSGTTYFYRARATNDLSYAISSGASFQTLRLSYYPLGENDAGKIAGDTASPVIFDSVGTLHLAASTNAPVYSCAVSPAATLATGSRLAMNFNGTNQSLSGPVLSTAIDNFCLEAWVKPATVGAGVSIIALNGSYAANGWGLVCFGDQFQGLLGGITFFGSATFSPGTWTHVAVVRDQGTATLYINGLSAGATGANPAVPNGAFAIGRAPESNGNLFNGAIDQVRFFTFEAGQFTTNALLLNAGPVTLTPSSPLILSQSAATISTNTVQLTATVNPNAAATRVYFQYGLSTNYGSVTATNDIGGGICTAPSALLITNLTLGSTYHFRAVAINSAGTNFGTNTTFVFALPPSIITLLPTSIRPTNAMLHASAFPNFLATAVYFQYGLTTNYGSFSATNLLTNNLNTTQAVAQAISGLTPGATYFYRAVASNLFSVAVGTNLTFIAHDQWMLNFDGADDFVRVSNSPAFNLSAVTMELWFKWGRSGSAVDFLVSKDLGLLEIHLGGVGNNALRFIPTAGINIDTAANAFIPGQWAHLACVYDPNPANNILKIYINGVEKTFTFGGNPMAPIGTSPSDFVLGQRAGGGLNFLGQMDEVRVWNYARSVSEIQANMNRSLTGNEPGLVAYYRFNEGTGATTADGTTNNRTGILNNGVAWRASTAPVDPPPPRFTSISMQPGGAMLLQFQVPENLPWILESSSDLTQWEVRLFQPGGANSQPNFTDIDAPLYPARFYRLRNP